MGAQESWFFIENGKVYYHTENDGVVTASRRHMVKKSGIDDSQGGESDQPYTSLDGRVHLVFNGAFYNFQKFRDELVDDGVQFTVTLPKHRD